MHISIRSIPIHYEIMGSGRPIVMLHGWAPDYRIMSGCFEPLFETLPEGTWKRIYFDLPGMGQTPGAEWINGSDDMLDIVIEFIDAVLPGENFLLAGESYGGLLARGLVAKRPQQVDGLILICPVGEPEPSKRSVEGLQVFEKDEALLNSLSQQDRDGFTAINVKQIQRVWERYRDEVLSGVKLANMPLWDRTISPKIAFTFPIDSTDRPFTRPTLILLGRQDIYVGYRDQWEFLDAYPHASYVVLDQAGHNLPIEQDLVFDALVKEWLDRVNS